MSLLARELRRAGFRAVSDSEGSLGSRLKRADKNGARLALILGPEERDCQSVSLLELDSGTQNLVNQANIIEKLTSLMTGPKASIQERNLLENKHDLEAESHSISTHIE